MTTTSRHITTATRAARTRSDRTRADQMRQILQQQRQALRDEIHDLMHADYGTDVPDQADTAEANAHSSLTFGLVQMHADTVRRIDSALARLNSGLFGTCASCGGTISIQRLTALPFAARCVTCEQGEEARLASILAERRESEPVMG